MIFHLLKETTRMTQNNQLNTNNDNERNLRLIVDETDESIRIDKYLSDELEDYSRSFLQKLIKDGRVRVNRAGIKSNYKVNPFDVLDIVIPKLVEPEIVAENIPLDILYEDDDIIVVNKPKGMVVHPAAGHYSGTLVNALMYHCKDNLSGINGVLRPGIVHRIDMNTTGALVVCKNDFAHNAIAQQLSVHSITRKYNAICYNSFSEEQGTVDAPIGRHPIDRKKMAIDYKNGRRAVTHYQVLENLNRYAYIECQLETGRTHQIRVHMSSIGHPILGDDVYSSAKSPYHLTGQTLHARVLGFIHPRTGKYMEFEAPIPEYFKKVLSDLQNKK
jgi:23S rRNA pseudouridine1911/1915/1917 synthase